MTQPTRKLSEPSPKSPTEDEAAYMLRRNKSFTNEIALNVTLTADDITPPAQRKDRWRSKFDFFTACAGFVIGLPSIWRFPNVCFQHGGGSFLVAYLILAVLIGLPMYQLELSIGQMMQTGFVRIWPTFSRRLTGVGLSAITLAFFCASYFGVIVAWAFFYLYKSLVQWPPVWGHDIHSSSKFFLEEVLRKAPRVEQVEWSSTNWAVLISLALVWMLAFMFVYKGSTRLTWVNILSTVTPLAGLVISAVLSMKLSGAMIGISYLLVPSFESLLSIRLWVDALVQVLFSLGIGWGVLINIASYSDRKNDFVSDSIIVFALSLGSSIAAAVSVFAVIGHLSLRYGESFEAVMTGGSGLIFKSVPIAFLDLPDGVARTATILFFVLVVTLGMASVSTMLQLLLTGITDARPCFSRCPGAVRALVVVCAVVIGSVPFALPNGVYLLETADEWVGSITLVTIAALELLAVTWYHSLERYVSDVHAETGIELTTIFKVPIRLIFPFFILALVLGGISDYQQTGDVMPRHRFHSPTVEEMKHLGCLGNCSGHGLCHKDQYCICGAGWGDLSCGAALDNPLTFSCPEGCNDRGACNSDTGTCSCVPEYKGTSCEIARYNDSKPFWLICLAWIWALGSLLPGAACYVSTSFRDAVSRRMEAPQSLTFRSKEGSASSTRTWARVLPTSSPDATTSS